MRLAWLLIAMGGAASACPFRVAPAPAEDWQAHAEQVVRTARADLVKDAKAQAPRVVLADLAINMLVRANRRELADDPNGARALRQFVTDQLPDTAWRLGYTAKQGDESAIEAGLTAMRHGLLGFTGDLCQAPWLESPEGAEAWFRAAQCRPSAEQAKEALLRAARTGHAGAQEALGQICLNQGDSVCAERWLCAAAQAGRIGAASALGYVLADPARNPAPPAAVVSAWLERAATRGDRDAANNYAEWLERQGGAAHLDAARQWYRHAAQAGLPEAMVNSARVSPSCAEQRVWLQAAIVAGLSSAQSLLSAVECDEDHRP